MEIGNALEELRKAKKISRKKLANGICSQQQIFKIETNQCDFDLFTFEILWERLGKSTDIFEFIFKSDSYKKIELRLEIESQVFQLANCTCILPEIEAYKLLEKYIHGCINPSNADLMYYYRTKAFIIYWTKQDTLENALLYLEKAIELTLPDWKKLNIKDILLSSWEIENILGYCRIYNQLYPDQQNNVYKIIYSLVDYITENIFDEELLCKVYPKCAVLLAEISYKKNEKISHICNEALRLLRKNSILYCQKELLEYIELTNEPNINCNYPPKQLQVLNFLFDHFTPDLITNSLFFKWTQCEYHLDSEILKAERISCQMSQEELSEGIFSNRASISYIETGKVLVSHSNFEALMQKLGQNKRRIGGFIIADNLSILEIAHEIRQAIGKGNPITAKEKLSQIKQKYYAIYQANKYYFTSLELTIEYMLEPDNAELICAKLYKIVSRCFDIHAKEYNRYPFRQEMDIILMWLGIAWKYQKQAALTVCRKLITAIDRSRVDNRHHYRTFVAILYRYAYFESEEGMLEDATKTCNYGIKYSILCGKGGCLNCFFWNPDLLSSHIDPNTLFDIKDTLTEMYYVESK